MIRLEDELRRWTELGLITDEQAVRIRAVEAGEPPPEGGPSVVTEALGYVGGALVVVASLLLARQLWQDLSDSGRLIVVGLASVLLLGAGLAVPAVRGTAGSRLRAALWGLSTIAGTLFAGILVIEVLDWQEERAAFAVLAATAAYGGALWARSGSPVQQVLVFAALCGAAASGTFLLVPSGPGWEALSGLGVIAVGVIWLFLGLRGRLAPAVLAKVLGAGGVVMGAAVTQMAGWGRVVSLLALAGLVSLALRLDQLLLLAIATVGMLLVVPPVVSAWFPGAVAAPLVLLACGLVLVLLALRAVRSRGGR